MYIYAQDQLPYFHLAMIESHTDTVQSAHVHQNEAV